MDLFTHNASAFRSSSFVSQGTAGLPSTRSNGPSDAQSRRSSASIESASVARCHTLGLLRRLLRSREGHAVAKLQSQAEHVARIEEFARVLGELPPFPLRSLDLAGV